MDWNDVTNAMMGVDYQLAYLPQGDLMGHTVLTVGETPGGATLGLLGLRGLALLCQR